MKKRNAKDVREFVRKTISKWKPALLLNEWTIEVYFETKEMDGLQDGYDALASVDVNTAYLKAQISIYPVFEHQPRDVQEDALVHELCHIISQPVADIITRQQNGIGCPPHESIDAIETLTQRITNIAMRSSK